ARAQDVEALEGYRSNMRCDLGDFDEYWGLLHEARRLREEDRLGREAARADDVRSAVASLRTGDVIHIPRTRRRGVAGVVAARDGKLNVLSEDRSSFRISAKDFDEPPTVLTRIALPRTGSIRSARFRRDVASALVSLQVVPPKRSKAHAADPKVERQAARLESAARPHPGANCPELPKHQRAAAGS